MKKKDIIQLVKNVVKENTFYGNREQPSQLSTGTKVSVPTDEYPFSAKPKRTGTGMMETQGTLSSDMLNYADQYHMELVDTMKGVSTHPDKRTGGFRILFPHYNGPDYTGAMFGKDVSMKIEKSKAAAKAAALKTYTKFQDQIEDYEITDHSRAGVHGSIHLWIMPKTMDENKELTDNPKLQPGKTVTYSGTRYKVIENSGYVLTLKSLESGNKLKLNLGQLKDKPIKENKMKKTTKEMKMYKGTDTKGGEFFFSDKDDATAKSKVAATNVKAVTPLEEEPDEGNAFGGAMQKAKDSGENSFKLDGKTYQVNEITPEEDEDENQSQDDIAMGVDDAKDFMEAYIKERGDDNLMEHMDKYRKRATLMEGATQKLFKLFNAGKTDAEVRSIYLQQRVDMPESFIAKLRNNWEALRKTKLDLTLADKEAEGFETIQPTVTGMEGGMEGGMEEKKQLASGLFNENKK